jgi:uncharacterized membrane protein YvbJ
MFCTQCGKKISDKAMFCEDFGKEISSNHSTSIESNASVGERQRQFQKTVVLKEAGNWFFEFCKWGLIAYLGFTGYNKITSIDNLVEQQKQDRTTYEFMRCLDSSKEATGQW